MRPPFGCTVNPSMPSALNLAAFNDLPAQPENQVGKTLDPACGTPLPRLGEDSPC